MLQYTKEQLTTAHARRLEELISYTGSHYHLASMLGVPNTTAQGWADRGRISKAGAKLVDEHPTLNHKFTAQYLRPELELAD